jgi:hypothetical protein
LTYYYGDDKCTFGYVGLTLKPKPFPKILNGLKNRINAWA